MPMKNETFYDLVRATMIKCLEVMRTKGEDYTEGSDNKLANFESEALELDLTAPQVIHIFANKHQKAINNYRKIGKLESEALEMRFVDRINYLFLELAEYIALGYDPREGWLIEALGDIEQPVVGRVAAEEGGRLLQIAQDLDKKPEDGEPCCGHPGSVGCCESAPPAPPAVEGEQRKVKQTRRRPPRPRIAPPQEDKDIPIAPPDRRLDPEVIAERARSKRQRDE